MTFNAGNLRVTLNNETSSSAEIYTADTPIGFLGTLDVVDGEVAFFPSEYFSSLYEHVAFADFSKCFSLVDNILRSNA